MIILFQFRLEWGRFTTPDLLWSAFPSHTPYHYAYNSPLIFSDPSGLAPEKEKDREELMGILPDDNGLLERVTEELNKSRQYMSSDMSNADGSPMGENQGLRLGSSGDYNFGYKYWTDGYNFERSYYINNHEGSFSYEEIGIISYGVEFVTSRNFNLTTAQGVDPKVWLNGAQQFLDGYSMVDQGPMGAIASVLSAIIDVYKGDYFSAGMGVLAAVPIAGIIGDAYKAGKLAQKFEKALSKVQHLDDLVRDAQKIYPDKAFKLELHHIEPIYLGGDLKGELYRLDAAYHQMITNEFRSLWKYRQGPVNEIIRLDMMEQVYKKYPLIPYLKKK